MITAMRFVVLGSGSGGNSAVVEAGGARLLIDAGLSAKQLVLRLARCGLKPEDLDGILLTHEHGDHIKGLRVFLKNRELPVYSNAATSMVVREQLPGVKWKIFRSGAEFAVGGLNVESFLVPHDAVEPVGFVFRSEARSFGMVSDSGHVTRAIVDRLRGVESVFVEANYDDALLEADLKRPWSTKQRIASRHGHLSNLQTAALVAELAEQGLERALLGHLSRDCNTPEKACEVVGACGLEVRCAGQEEPTEWCGTDAGRAVRARG